MSHCEFVVQNALKIHIKVYLVFTSLLPNSTQYYIAAFSRQYHYNHVHFNNNYIVYSGTPGFTNMHQYLCTGYLPLHQRVIIFTYRY